MSENIPSHEHQVLEWLRSHGFEIKSLEIGEWVKSKGCDELYSRSGRYAYCCWLNHLKNGLPWLLVHAKVGDRHFEYQTKAIDVSRDRLSTSYSFQAFPSSQPHETKKQTPEQLERIHAMWDKGVSCGPSPYLDRKGVKPYGLKFFVSKRSACVPVKGVSGTIQGLQFLNSDGSKRFLEGSKVAGGFHLIGLPSESLILVEGYATGAFLHELLGLPVCVCFSASNLTNVAVFMRETNPETQIWIASDNDRHLSQNEGVIAAEKASRAINGRVLIPDFGSEPANRSASDWLDLSRIFGIDEVKRQLQGHGIPLHEFHID